MRRGLVVPPGHVLGELPDREEREEEGDRPDRQGRTEMAPQRGGLDLGSGQEGQESRAKGRQEVDPGRGLQAEEVPGDDSERDLDQRDGDPEPDRNEAREQRQSHPRRGDEPDVVGDELLEHQASTGQSGPQVGSQRGPAT